jgi:hypothetical protein
LWSNKCIDRIIKRETCLSTKVDDVTWSQTTKMNITFSLVYTFFFYSNLSSKLNKKTVSWLVYLLGDTGIGNRCQWETVMMMMFENVTLDLYVQYSTYSMHSSLEKFTIRKLFLNEVDFLLRVVCVWIWIVKNKKYARHWLVEYYDSIGNRIINGRLFSGDRLYTSYGVQWV